MRHLNINYESSIGSGLEDTPGFYTSADPYGQNLILETFNRTGIQKHLLDFVEEGYEFSREYSFALEGYGTPEGYEDSVLALFITIAMINPSDSSRAAYLFYSTCEFGSIVSKYILSFVEPNPEDDFEFVTDGVWRFNYPSVVYYDKKQMDISSSVATIYDYLDCVEEGTAAGCAAALMGCAFASPGYPACAAGGCASAFLASALLCLFTDL